MCLENRGRVAVAPTPSRGTHYDAPSLMEKNWKVERLYGNRNCPEERKHRRQSALLWVIVVFLKIERYCVRFPLRIGEFGVSRSRWHSRAMHHAFIRNGIFASVNWDHLRYASTNFEFCLSTTNLMWTLPNRQFLLVCDGNIWQLQIAFSVKFVRIDNVNTVLLLCTMLSTIQCRLQLYLNSQAETKNVICGAYYSNHIASFPLIICKQSSVCLTQVFLQIFD